MGSLKIHVLTFQMHSIRCNPLYVQVFASKWKTMHRKEEILQHNTLNEEKSYSNVILSMLHHAENGEERSIFSPFERKVHISGDCIELLLLIAYLMLLTNAAFYFVELTLRAEGGVVNYFESKRRKDLFRHSNKEKER